MGQVVPSQHPAVVLRSRFNHLRALLAVALIALIGLTVAVVILANDEDQRSDTSSAAPIGKTQYGGLNPSTHQPVPLPQPAHPLGSRPGTGTTRYDGGPEEGTNAIGQRSAPPARYEVNPSTGYASPRYDGGPDEGTRGVPAPPSSSAAADGSAYTQLRSADALRHDGGPKEGTRGP